MKTTICRCALMISMASSVGLAQQCDSSPRPPAASLDNTCNQSYPIPSDLFRAAPDGTWVRGTWTKDRRPAAFLRFTEPSRLWWDNPRNVRSWWHVNGSNDIASFGKKYSGDPSIGLISIPPEIDTSPDQFDALVWELDKIYSEGLRRIVLFVPAGSDFGATTLRPNPSFDPSRPEVSPDVNNPIANSRQVYAFGGHDYSQNQWWKMPAWKRAGFSDSSGVFQTWRRTHSDCTLELYTGVRLQDNYCTTCTTQTVYGPIGGPVEFKSTFWLDQGSIAAPRLVVPPAPGRYFTPCAGADPETPLNPLVPAHLEQFHKMVGPWVDAGIRTVWLDAAANNSGPRGGFLELSYQPFYRDFGVRFGGERSPTAGQTDGVIDQCALRLAPWCSLQQTFFDRGVTPLRWRSYIGQGYFDRKETECHLLVENPFTLTWPYWRRARNEGLVISLFECDNTTCEMLKRWYSMGKFYWPNFNGDLDANGRDIIDQKDWDDFYAAYTDTARAVTVFGSGDVNADGAVDTGDYQRYQAAWQLHMNNPGYRDESTFLVDFGAPDDL
ncbi:MAG: hypothetical protein SFZ23_13860 [Planctomycetota bacterium]|nr:hypothetical protein [Planctomycetota bacterium]